MNFPTISSARLFVKSHVISCKLQSRRDGWYFSVRVSVDSTDRLSLSFISWVSTTPAKVQCLSMARMFCVVLLWGYSGYTSVDDTCTTDLVS